MDYLKETVELVLITYWLFIFVLVIIGIFISIKTFKELFKMKFKKTLKWDDKVYKFKNYRIVTFSSGGLCESLYDIKITNLKNNYKKYYSYQILGLARKRLYKLIKQFRREDEYETFN